MFSRLSLVFASLHFLGALHQCAPEKTSLLTLHRDRRLGCSQIGQASMAGCLLSASKRHEASHELTLQLTDEVIAFILVAQYVVP